MNRWTRIPLILCSIAVILALTGTLFWAYIYRANYKPPSRASLPSLSDDAFVHGGANGTVVIDAANFYDAIRGLGYAHALDHAWTMAVWRQAASGQLAHWLDGPALTADRLAVQLGLAELAKVAYGGLPEEDRLFVEAYVDGVNAAWPVATRRGEFLVLGVESSDWEPWQVLSIERLLAWLSEPALRGCGPVMDLCLGDQALRSTLHVYGFEHSVAWHSTREDRPVLYQRHVSGAYARPIYQEITLRIAGWPPVSGASIIGTPFIPAAYSDSSAWALLLSSPRALVEARAAPLQFARITSTTGNEHLVSIGRAGDQLTIGTAKYALEWAGLEPRTDIGAWRSMLQRKSVEFTLLRGDGIHMDIGHPPQITGQPLVQALYPNVVLIGNRLEAASLAQSIGRDVALSTDFRLWTTHLHSGWSEDTLSARLSIVDEGLIRTPENASALAYLQNWDHQFQGYSIGATIFSEWMRLSEPDPTDALTRAVERLTQRFGPDQSLWRWDNLHRDERFFLLPNALQTNHFAPLSWPGEGHSTTMVWGGETFDGAPVPPATWEMWLDPGSSTPVTVRRRHIDWSVPLGRSIAEADEPIIFGLPTRSQHSITLHP